jgi:DNA-binding transcriptional LysR family regulator
MVQQGLGATVMPRLAAEPVPSDVQICALPEPIARIIGIAVLANGLHPPAVFAFLDFLKEHQHQPDEMPQKA